MNWQWENRKVCGYGEYEGRGWELERSGVGEVLEDELFLRIRMFIQY